MMLKPITIVAAGLAVAQAFLLPPPISVSDINIVNDIPEIVPQALSHHISLPCKGCLTHFKGNKHGYSKPTEAAVDRTYNLELYLSLQKEANKQDKLVISTGSDRDYHELYPNPTSDRTPLRAHLTSSESSEIVKKLRGHRSGSRHRNQPLSYTLSTVEQHVNKEDGLQLIDLEFQVLSVGKKAVELTPIYIKLVKNTKNGALAFGHVEVIESETKPDSSRVSKQEKCTNFLCEWYKVVKDKAEKMKIKCGGGAGKAKTHRPPPSHQHHGGRPHKVHPPKEHHGHATSEFFKNFAVHILFPILVGVIAGFTVSFIGMAIGSLIVVVWRAFFRKPSQRRRSCTHKASQKEAVVAEVEEKAGLMENQEDVEDAPPAYEDGKDVPPV